VTAPPARTLRETQEWMVGAIAGAEAGVEHDLEHFVTAGPRMTATERFEIYRSGYHARLVECLRDDYPVLAAMLGDEQFGLLCRAYVDRHPSASPNLNGFGQHMARLCRDVQLVGEGADAFDARRDFASELATLEWALVEVLHAACPPPLEVAALQSVPPDAWARARFIKSDALRLLRFEYPVNAVFIANRIEETVPEIPGRSPNAVAVYRKDTQLWRMDLTPAMMGILEPLAEGKSLGEALAAIEESVTDPDVLAETGANLMVWFREWADAGFFTRIEIDPATGA